MLKLLILPFLLVLFWQGSVLSWAGAHGSETTKTKLQRLEFAGRERVYYLYFPESCRGKSKLPLVLVLHGAMENGKVIRKISGMDAEAERRGVLLAYPYGSGVLKKKLLMWNAFDCCGLAAKKDIDDVAFISALIDKLCADYPIDKTRIFACGYSNGAMFCFRLASALMPVVNACLSFQNIQKRSSTMAKYEWTMLTAIGGRMLEVRDGYAFGELPLSDTVKQPTEVFHAGAIVTLADEVASAAIHGEAVEAVMMKGKKFPYSIQLSVNLLTNDPVGPLRAESNVIRNGGVAVVDTIVTTCTGETAALMRSVHRMVDLNRT